MTTPVSILVASFLLAAVTATAQDLGEWAIHDEKRPQPRVVDPGTESTAEQPGRPPSDAIVLFDGKDLAQWRALKTGAPAPWKVENGYVEVVPKSGGIETAASFGDCQLHIEWAAPSPPVGSGQDRGNSGVFLMGQYEVQVLDSYQSKTYPDGQASALYGQYPPLVNATRPPGQWQTYDIVFRAPRFSAEGALDAPRAAHCDPQRRAHSGRSRTDWTHGPQGAARIQGARGQTPARPAGSRSSGALPEHLDSRAGGVAASRGRKRWPRPSTR